MMNIEYVELEHIENKTLYKFIQNDDKKIKIGLKPNNLESYKGWIGFSGNSKKYPVPMKVLLGEKNFTSKERDQFEAAKLLRGYFDDEERLNVDNTDDIEEIIKEIIIYDNTEKEINGYSHYDITGKSTWLFNGRRRCSFSSEQIGLKKLKKSKKNSFFIDTIDGNKTLYSEEIAIDDSCCNFILDTEKIGMIVNEEKIENLAAKCFIKIELKFGSNEIIIQYPVEIKFLDLKKENTIHDKTEVSIDFGTSSTCVSHGNSQMLHFAGKVLEGSEKEYENLTSFIIYDWDRIKEEWKSDIETPHLKKAHNDLTTDELRSDNGQAFGDGENVKNLMRIPSREILGATVSNIKELALKKNVKRFRQFLDYKKSDDLKLGFSEAEDLNPIEFYAYQIGRKLNSTVKGNVYTRYHLTMPVKYPPKAMKKIKESFEKGLKRSLPTNLRGELEVNNKYNEPTALLGSLLMDHFNHLDKPKFFSIFDFGGGTLDYIFGVVRPAYEDNKFSLEDEEEYEAVIELFNNGGSNKCGGENILRRLAYRIYLQNIDKLGDDVPILKPEGESFDDRVSSILYGEDIKNRVNLEMIVEKVAREVLYSIKLETINKKKNWTSSLLEKNEVTNSSFEEEELTIKSAKKVSDQIDYIYKKSGITFQTINSNNIKPYDLKVDVKELIDLYRKIVSENIIGFKRNLEDIASSQRVKEIAKELNIKVDSVDFNIFLAGNSCKSKVVEVLMKNNFEYNEIELAVTNRYSLKTAVARGYNFLNADYLVYDWKRKDGKVGNTKNQKTPLKYKIIKKSPNKSEVDTVIPKNSHYSGDFKRLCGLESGSNTFTIDYIEGDHAIDRFSNQIKQKVVTIPNDIIEKYVVGKGKLHIYIDAFDYEKVIYTFGKKKGISEEAVKDIEILKEKCVVTL